MSASSADGQAAIAAAAKEALAGATATRSLLGTAEDGDVEQEAAEAAPADATVAVKEDDPDVEHAGDKDGTPEELRADSSSSYATKVQEAIAGSTQIQPPDDSIVRQGPALPADDKNPHVAMEWRIPHDDNNPPDGVPGWKLPHEGWVPKAGEPERFTTPKWFEVYLRFDTSERTTVLARTTANFVPVMDELPFSIVPGNGLSLVAYANDPGEEYGIFAIEAHIIEESS